jgi:hypothetical protein
MVGDSIEPESQWRIYWTMVSIDTFVSAGLRGAPMHWVLSRSGSHRQPIPLRVPDCRWRLQGLRGEMLNRLGDGPVNA